MNMPAKTTMRFIFFLAILFASFVICPFVQSACPQADLNNDCRIDVYDFAVFAEQWMATDGTANFDGVGDVGLADLIIMTDNWLGSAPTVLINEFLASNDSREPLEVGDLLDEDGDSSDWIELYNQTAINIDLSGWYLTDDIKNKTKWQFPAVTLDGGQYLIVFASGKNRRDPAANLHTNFALEKAGEYLALVTPDGTGVGCEYFPEYPPQKTDISYGLYGDDFRYFGVSTPGFTNSDQVFMGFVADTQFTHNRGFYDDAFDVTITSATPGATIVYTTDGSFPSLDNGTAVAAPDDNTPPAAVVHVPTTTILRAAAFKANYIETNIDTHTYVFLEDVVEQPIWPDGFPTSWNGYTADYEMDPDIVDNPLYSDHMRGSLLSLPTISIVTDVDYLFDDTIGIYSNPLQDSEAWERPASVEFFTHDGLKEFQIDCGLKIQGGWFRSPTATPKHSFRLLFQEEYGPVKLEFDLFDYDENAADRFDTIVLRAGANDGYSWDAAYLTDSRETPATQAHTVHLRIYMSTAFTGDFIIPAKDLTVLSQKVTMEATRTQTGMYSNTSIST
jgi:hypothetical protein